MVLPSKDQALVREKGMARGVGGGKWRVRGGKWRVKVQGRVSGECYHLS